MRQRQFLKFAFVTLVVGLVVIGCRAMEGEPLSTTMEEEMTSSPMSVGTPTSSPTPTVSAMDVSTGTETTTASLTAGCYRIAMVDRTLNEDGTSTWTYEVEELECAHDLSYWVLELPDCVSLVSASGEYEMVDPDPNTDLSGIKWQTGAGFESGTFEVVLDAEYEEDDVQAAVKGPDVAYGEIAGPGCDVEDEPDDGDDGVTDDDGDDDDDTDVSCENLNIDPGALPPPGECKVWDPDLPAGQQGAPVECDCSNLVPGTCLIDSDGNVVDCD